VGSTGKPFTGPGTDAAPTREENLLRDLEETRKLGEGEEVNQGGEKGVNGSKAVKRRTIKGQ